jgi:ABC-type bacteriocin/lantibiotic exporter with double-glycine peptidase domain
MLGLLRPKSGDIYFKGESIFSNLSKWRNEIGYISQNVYLLNGSIKKNISFNFFDESFDEEKLKQAISLSNLNNMISKLPEGIQTKVGNDGILLSGGERQRIALARAIYKNPNIYFLDESTSALDEQTEEEIMNNIKKNFKKKTIILISHRTSSIEKCDKVLTLDNGMIY